jgi:hypothetical protein
MFSIPRPAILMELISSLNDGSVVLTGAPGIGKSWLLAAAAEQFRKEKKRLLVLAAEGYDVSSLEELTERLDLPLHIVTFLNSLGDDVLLFIDGLDALRSEVSAKTFRTLIEQTMQHAPRVKILVTIRTFDLDQSYLLRRVLKRGTFKTIRVGELTDSELQSATTQAPEFGPLLSVARPPMYRLLRNPFMLRLALSLISGGVSYEVIGGYRSEIELLARFWNRRVETVEDSSMRRSLLGIVARMMADRKLLSLPSPDVLNTDLIAHYATVFERLQSDEILREKSDRIMFDHNILFDYAASRLVITLESLLTMMRDDASRSIFLRPSIGYFLTGLWIQGVDRKDFWSLFMEAADPRNGFQERLSLAPAAVVAENLIQAEDLSALDTWPHGPRVRAIRAILRSVGIESFSSSNKRSAWSSVFEHILRDMQGDYVNEMIRLLNQLAEVSPRKEKPRAAVLARQTLYWAWKEADRPESKCDPVALTSVVTGRLLPLILENYSEAPDETRSIVLRLLGQFGHPNGSPKDAMYVVWGLKHIVDADPLTAATVVNSIFEYEETSKAKTEIGSSTIMPFTSDRRQDFELARYTLQREYPYFLQKAPLQALSAAIAAVQHQVLREHSSALTSAASFNYVYDGTAGSYTSDLSEIWDQGYRNEISLTLLDTCFRELIGENGSRALPSDVVIETVVRVAKFAVVWRHVFSPFLGVDNELLSAILPMLEIPEFLAAAEVTRSIGGYLEKLYGTSPPSGPEKVRIENAILALGRLSKSVSRYETTQHTRDRLLARIPLAQLTTQSGRDLRKDSERDEQDLDNEPYVRSQFGQLNLSNEQFLEMRGVDTKNPRSQALLRAVEPLRTFSGGFVNSTPTDEEAQNILADLKSAWIVLRSDDDNSEIAQNAAGIIAACAAAISKNEHITSMEEISSLCREILLSLSSHIQPEVRPDDKFDHPGWGAPLTRIEVAEGIMSFGAQFPNDADIIATIRTLASDPVPAVRFQIAIRLGMFLKSRSDLFREVMNQMIQNERTAGVLGGLTQTINRIAYLDPDLATALIRSVIELPHYPEVIERFGQEFLLVTLLQLDVFRGNENASALLGDIVQNPEKNIGAMIRLAHHVRQVAEIENISADNRTRALEWLLRLVVSCNQSLNVIDERTDQQDYFLNLLKCLETIVFQIMILLDVDPNLHQGGETLNELERQAYYEQLEPILSELIIGARNNLRITPPTALNLLKIFTRCLSYSPRKILRMAVIAVAAGARYGFNNDYMAISEFVEFAEVFLADYRDLLRDAEAATQFADLLDVFMRAGWPQAIQMVMTLDEAMR